jgi:hypothetical protein
MAITEALGPTHFLYTGAPAPRNDLIVLVAVGGLEYRSGPMAGSMASCLQGLPGWSAVCTLGAAGVGYGAGFFEYRPQRVDGGGDLVVGEAAEAEQEPTVGESGQVQR